MSEAFPARDVARPYWGLPVFFLIAFGLPWAGWIILRQTITLDHMFDSFGYYWFTAGPSIAGFLAAYAEDGLRGLRRFCRRVFNLRFAFWVWLAALLLPLLAALLTFAPHAADLLKGGTPKWASLLGTISLMNFFTGPIAEEFGWRGYLLDRLARHMRPVLAGLLIGPIWIAWHIPLFYDSVFAHVSSALGYSGWVIAWSVVLALIVAKARGSVLPSVLGHWAANAAPGVFFALLPALPGEDQPGGLAFTLASLVVALVAAILWGGARWEPRE
ncbi:MAG TPA: CPBP family intramembrane glutamic endopeptidase [Rhizomicrobium sp.]|nr:CPBP family intramembrane glutamic endopeptidase [Rhizomicrobium sp.]